jgi:Zn-dependent protease with chaperone function
MRTAFLWAISVGAPLALVVALILVAGAHSWSDEATQWGIMAVLGGATIIDLLVSRWKEKASGGDRTSRPRDALK